MRRKKKPNGADTECVDAGPGKGGNTHSTEMHLL